ncbi:MAG: acylneuraminate cytidylyltransferase family protein [Candidatus Aenigmarchaeota archaeon]|nr:acylneuraminate cytidylyltransferase family protein [Candidatus Aenigmarchaeota archaeon]
MKVVAIIPARGGSKCIPRKNIKQLAGKPLISYPIMAAKSCKSVGRVVVSTEDEEIADVARTYNAEIISRPAELAEDETPTLPVLVHAVKELKKSGYKPDIIVLLYATAPLVESHYIEEGIKKVVAGADSAVSVCEDTRNYKLWKNGKPLFKKRLNRQSVKKVYRENGAFYIMTYDTLMKKRSITGKKTGLIVMKPEESVDIDTPLDLELAKVLISKGI